MYEFLKSIVLSILRCPKEPPPPPVGSYESVYVFRAAPSYLTYRLLGIWAALAGECLVGLIILFAYPLLDFWGMLIIGGGALLVLLQGILAYVTTRLDYEMRYYIITDRSLRIREGVWNIRETTLTFANIQNMKIEQGPIQRLFGLYDLAVETAGGGGNNTEQDPRRPTSFHRGVFRGIKKPAELREVIMKTLRGLRTSGLGDLDEEGSPAPAAAGGSAAGSQPASVGAAQPSEILGLLREIAAETARWRNELAARG